MNFFSKFLGELTWQGGDMADEVVFATLDAMLVSMGVLVRVLVDVVLLKIKTIMHEFMRVQKLVLHKEVLIPEYQRAVVV